MDFLNNNFYLAKRKMKLKILNLLVVSLVTFVVLSPGIIIFNLIWGKHIELVRTQNLSEEFTKINQEQINQCSDPSFLQTQSINYPPSLGDRITDKRLLPVHNFLGSLYQIVQKYQIMTILQWLLVAVPIGIGLAILVYDRYLVYRSAVFRAQVEMLERLWQQSIEQ